MRYFEARSIDRKNYLEKRKNMAADVPATEKQISFLTSLLEQKEHPFENLEVEKLSKSNASAMIDQLVNFPRKQVARKQVSVVAAGMYLLNSEPVKVVESKTPGRFYAKVLRDGSFEFVPGLVQQLTEEHKMTLEQAKKYGKETGTCCSCGRTLTNPESIEAGIGPICAGRF